MATERSPRRGPLSYAEAGVDIDAGNALVEAIKPLVKATRYPGGDADIGGFGGLFDLARAGDSRRTQRHESTFGRSTHRRCSHGWLRPVPSPRPEMLRTFNCGIGMVIVTEPARTEAVTRIFEAATDLAVVEERIDGPLVFDGTFNLKGA